MKKKTGNRLGILVILLVVLAASAMSCANPDVVADTTIKVEITGGWIADIQKVTLEGHEYWLYDGGYNGGMCHSESCPCKTVSE